MSTAIKVTALLAACAFGLLMVVLVRDRRDAARTAEEQANPAAVHPLTSAGATNGSDSNPSPTPMQDAAPASGVNSTAAKPVVIGVVTPWTEIARMPQYVQASSAGRMAIRDLYWRVCVEEKIPAAQRTSTYELFVRDWDTSESGGLEAATRATSVSQSRREQQQATVPSPVNAATMRRWCKS